MESIEKASMFNLDAALKPGVRVGLGCGGERVVRKHRTKGAEKVLRMGKQVFEEL